MTSLVKIIPVLLIGTLFLASGCTSEPKQSSQAQPIKQNPDQKPIAVDVAIAKVENLETNTEFIGTTAPIREVSVRSRTEGQLISLNVDIGDPVSQGQILGQQDDGILRANVLQVEAELAARQSEVARAITQVSNAKTQVERARLEFEQAQADAKRLRQLALEGAIASQTAEQAQTNANTSNQAWQSTKQQVRSQENEVASAQKRVQAQVAVINQAKERLAYTTLTASTSGVVLEKVSEAGNLLQPGNEVIKLGDFSRVKVLVEVSELERSQIRQGQTATVKLDAFPNQSFIGQVLRISPAADRISRLIPIEVAIANRNNQIGSGLLARVSFDRNASTDVVAPATALQVGGREQKNQVFVLKESGENISVQARAIEVGNRADGKVAILTGLNAGEQFIIRSSRPLKDGDKVVLSALSEKKGKDKN